MKMNEWIKCSERMPELYDFVLVCANFQGTGKTKPIQIARRTFYNNEDSKIEYWDFCGWICSEIDGACMDLVYPMARNDITHWLPLPKPPQD
jgi:hypothetical protein